jgi:hypothetical protein
MITNKQIDKFVRDIELGKVYTDKDRPPFKTPKQISDEKEKE